MCLDGLWRSRFGFWAGAFATRKRKGWTSRAKSFKNALKRQAQSYLSIPPTWLSLGTWNVNAQDIEWLGTRSEKSPLANLTTRKWSFLLMFILSFFPYFSFFFFLLLLLLLFCGHQNVPGRPPVESVWLLGHWSLDLCRNSRSLPLNLHCALHPLFLRGWLFVRLSLVTWKTNAFLQRKGIQGTLSTHSKVIFIKSPTFCSRINFSKNDNVHPEGQRKVIICSTNFHHNLHKIWCALKVSGGVGLAFGPLEPLSLSQSMGQWERLHSATFTFCQAFCSTAMPFILNLHDASCIHVWSADYSFESRLRPHTHTKKNLTNGDGKAWCMILKLQKQIQRDISSSMVLLSSSFHLVLLDY